MHFLAPHLQAGIDAVREAMKTTFFHWGVRAGQLCGSGADFGLFYVPSKLPLTLRSALYPLIGDRIYGWLGTWLIYSRLRQRCLVYRRR